MAQGDARSPLTARRRGRPVGSDSVETRHGILRAARQVMDIVSRRLTDSQVTGLAALARQVINQRGYQAATFQAIARAAGLSRPTLHYYFSSREEIYLALVAQADDVLAECLAEAQRKTSLVDQISAFITAIHRADHHDGSQVAFLVSARLESTRNPELRPHGATGLGDFLTLLVSDAQKRGELDADVAIAPVVEMLRALMWGIGFYVGFADDGADICRIARQLDELIQHGLVDGGDPSPTRGDTDGDTPSAVGGRQ